MPATDQELLAYAYLRAEHALRRVPGKDWQDAADAFALAWRSVHDEERLAKYLNEARAALIRRRDHLHKRCECCATWGGVWIGPRG